MRMKESVTGSQLRLPPQTDELITDSDAEAAVPLPRIFQRFTADPQVISRRSSVLLMQPTCSRLSCSYLGGGSPEREEGARPEESPETERQCG